MHMKNRTAQDEELSESRILHVRIDEEGLGPPAPYSTIIYSTITVPFLSSCITFTME